MGLLGALLLALLWEFAVFAFWTLLAAGILGIVLLMLIGPDGP